MGTGGQGLAGTGTPCVWRPPKDLLSTWPWVLRRPLFSCQVTLSVGSGPPSSFPVLFSLTPLSRGSCCKETHCDHWLCSPEVAQLGGFVRGPSVCQGLCCRSQTAWLGPRLCHSQAVGPLATFFTSLNLGFLFFRVGLTGTLYSRVVLRSRDNRIVFEK